MRKKKKLTLRSLFIISFVLLLLTIVMQYGFPCEILILSRTDTDESKGQYGRYDPVTIKPNGWEWGKVELNKSFFWRLKVPNVTEEQAKYIIDEDLANNKKRKCKLYLNKLSQSEQDELENNGVITLSSYDLEDLKKLIKVKE